jgi:hypothetical protein
MKHKLIGLLVGGLVLASASPSFAAAPANVTVRVEGTVGALVAPTAITTTTTPVTKDGTHACTGTSAAGALEQATAGDWGGDWSDGFGSYSVNRIKNEDFGGFSPSAPFYWAFAVNDAGADAGICGTELQPGDEVLFYKACNAPGATGCYSGDVLSIAGPASVRPGDAFTVTVQQVATTFDSSPPYAKHVTRGPAAAATVAVGGQRATTDADGRAALTVPDAGPVAVRVTKGDNNVPDQYSLCVTRGDDGFCGTATPPAATPGGAPCVTRGDDGFCGTADKRAAYGFISSIREKQRFARGKGPRELKGRTDQDASGIKDVRLRLTRNDAGRCSTYDGTREAFKTMKRCGAARGTWFSVGDRSDWSYLLPSRLGRGRYVLDLQVVDRAGNADSTLARGRNRVVFTVG